MCTEWSCLYVRARISFLPIAVCLRRLYFFTLKRKKHQHSTWIIFVILSVQLKSWIHKKALKPLVKGLSLQTHLNKKHKSKYCRWVKLKLDTKQGEGRARAVEGKEPVKDQMLAKSNGSESRWVCLFSLGLSKIRQSCPVWCWFPLALSHQFCRTWCKSLLVVCYEWVRAYIEWVHNNFSYCFSYKVLALSKLKTWNPFLLEFLCHFMAVKDRIRNKALNIHSKELKLLVHREVFGLSRKLTSRRAIGDALTPFKPWLNVLFY